MAEQKSIKVGQVWRRKSDGVRVRVVRVISYRGTYSDLDIEWKRIDRYGHGAVFESNWRKRYEFVGEEPS